MIPVLFAETLPLWPDGAPGALGSEEQDVPTLTAHLPAEGKSNGASFLVLPGGGYGSLANHEGEGYAKWLACQGIAAYVLKYRLGSSGYRHPVMIQDAARALRTIRAWVRRDGRDPARIGIIGSSAGGHLTQGGGRPAREPPEGAIESVTGALFLDDGPTGDPLP